MQHLTIQELVDFELVGRGELPELFKFTVVRNPFARSLSDYYYLLRNLDPPFGAPFSVHDPGGWEMVRGPDEPVD